MTVALDVTGERFGLLVAVERSGKSDRYGVYWICQCDCGNTTEIVAAGLRSGGTKSCGCRQGPWRHGGARRSGEHPLYQMWLGMKARCSQVGHQDYHRYGGRGIAVCDRWSSSFDAFLQDVGERPSDPPDWEGGLPYWSLDRVDGDGDYEPGNVRWATWKQQAANRRPRKKGSS